MPVVALLALEQRGRRIPIARTSRRPVLRALARAALSDIREVARGESDELLAALLVQEADRLGRSLAALGLGAAEAPA
jgi:hypothetical protein